MSALKELKIERIEEEEAELLEKFVTGEIEEKSLQQCQQVQREKRKKLKEFKQLQEATNRVIGKLKNSLHGLQEKEREAQVELLAYVLENIKEKIKEAAGDLVNQATAIHFLNPSKFIQAGWDKEHYGVFLTSIFPMPSLEEHAKMKKQIEGELFK
jgi:predicted transcriptional regulator